MNEPAPACPYKGLVPYDEQDARFFFGRERDARRITASLYAAPLTLLYGGSGVGKSSVINAAVLPELRTHTHDLVVVARAWRDQPLESFRDTVSRSAAAAMPGFAPPERGSLEALFKACSDELERRSPPPTEDAGAIATRMLVIIDQFDEYFTYHDEGSPFEAEFARAVVRPDYRSGFLISMREDSLARLDRFDRSIPFLFDTFLRINPLPAEAAAEALRKPLEVFNREHPQRPVSIEDGLVDDVIKEVQTGLVTFAAEGKGGRAAVLGKRERGVETPYLQLVMTRLWDAEMSHNSPALRAATFERLGRAERIVQSHVDEMVQKHLRPEDFGVAARLFEYLITPSGAKIAYTADDIAAIAKVDLAAARRVLECLSAPTARVLRSTRASHEGSEVIYEVFHDRLGRAVTAWRQSYQTTSDLARRFKDIPKSDRAMRAGVARVLRAMTGPLGTAPLTVVQIAQSAALDPEQVRRVLEKYGSLVLADPATSTYRLRTESVAILDQLGDQSSSEIGLMTWDERARNLRILGRLYGAIVGIAIFLNIEFSLGWFDPLLPAHLGWFLPLFAFLILGSIVGGGILVIAAERPFLRRDSFSLRRWYNGPLIAAVALISMSANFMAERALRELGFWSVLLVPVKVAVGFGFWAGFVGIFWKLGSTAYARFSAPQRSQS